MRIELTLLAWEANVLPLNYICMAEMDRLELSHRLRDYS